MTVATREGVIRYQVTFYHDEPQEASADSYTLRVPYKTVAGAIRGARSVINSHWQTASIHRGTYYPAVPGVRPDEFEDDLDVTPVRVGKDWVER